MTDHENRKNQAGNMLFLILLAIVLIGLLTAAISQSGDSNSNIDNETLAIRTSEVQSFAAELERAVMFILQNGASESEIRFAHPDNHSDYGILDPDADNPSQVFDLDGGGASFRAPPEGLTNTASQSWEFYGDTAAPGIGSDRADLMIVLPDVTLAFCERVNRANNLVDSNGEALELTDSGTCVNEGSAQRFDDGTQFASSPNTMDEGSFPQNAIINKAQSTPEACVICDDKSMHYYHVILAR